MAAMSVASKLLWACVVFFVLIYLLALYHFTLHAFSWKPGQPLQRCRGVCAEVRVFRGDECYTALCRTAVGCNQQQQLC